MLYLTTRNDKDAYTAYRTLASDCGPDGGLFLPFQMPKLDADQIAQLKEKSYGQTVADILNLFFAARLDAWDVDVCIGKFFAKLVPMSHRIHIAEVWHNPDSDFARMVRNLSSRIRGTGDTNNAPTNWAWISIRIATLFGLYGELCRINMISVGQCVDIAMPSGDFAAPMAAWYARQMGLPIGNIICSCDENDAAWELLKNGELTVNPSMGQPYDLERLIHATLGQEETLRYLECFKEGKTYALSTAQGQMLRQGMYPAVISWSRRESIISALYRSSAYIVDPGSAMAYGGLQDYRATEGESRPALILTERSPALSAETVSKAMGITEETLKARLNLT